MMSRITRTSWTQMRPWTSRKTIYRTMPQVPKYPTEQVIKVSCPAWFPKMDHTLTWQVNVLTTTRQSPYWIEQSVQLVINLIDELHRWVRREVVRWNMLLLESIHDLSVSVSLLKRWRIKDGSLCNIVCTNYSFCLICNQQVKQY